MADSMTYHDPCGYGRRPSGYYEPCAGCGEPFSVAHLDEGDGMCEKCAAEAEDIAKSEAQYNTYGTGPCAPRVHGGPIGP